jgi:hypothetical protein
LTEAELFSAYRKVETVTDETLPADDHRFDFPPTVEPGTHAARFMGAHDFTYTDKATGEDVTLVSWAFGVGSNGDVVVVEGVTSMLLSPRSKGFAWLRAIAPEIVKSRSSVDASELGGAPCLIVVEDREGESRVTDVLAPVK